MRRLILLLLFCSYVSSLSAQTQIAIQNPGFEQDTATLDNYNFGPVPGWTCTGQGGLWQPLSRGYFSAIPDGATVLWRNSGSCSQDLQVQPQPNSISTLKVPVGHRNDGYSNIYTISLTAGAMNCTQSGSNTLIPLGTFAVQTLVCPVGALAPTDNIVLTLASAGSQIQFDGISLSYTSTTPTTFFNFNFNAHLRFCALCDGTDDATTGLSLLSGMQLQVFQGLRLVTTLTANDTGDIAGPVALDVSLDPLVFNVLLVSPSGVTLCPVTGSTGGFPQPANNCFQITTGLDTLGAWGLINGVNMFTPAFTGVGFTIRLDSKTGLKRGAQQWLSP